MKLLGNREFVSVAFYRGGISSKSRDATEPHSVASVLLGVYRGLPIGWTRAEVSAIGGYVAVCSDACSPAATWYHLVIVCVSVLDHAVNERENMVPTCPEGGGLGC